MVCSLFFYSINVLLEYKLKVFKFLKNKHIMMSYFSTESL